MKCKSWVALVLTIISTSVMALDLSSPESALRSLEEAYVRGDIEAAVASKDFAFEAREMLRPMHLAEDEALVKETAEVLQLSFRSEMKKSGFPDFSQLRCNVISTKEIQAGLVKMVEVCTFPDGVTSEQTMHAAHSLAGWRIVTMKNR